MSSGDTFMKNIDESSKAQLVDYLKSQLTGASTGMLLSRLSDHTTLIQGLNFFINTKMKTNIELNRKMLSEIAIADEAAFDLIVEKAKAAL